jgi:hypothetical protein
MTLIGHERDLDEAYVRPGQTQTFRVRPAAGDTCSVAIFISI